MRIVETKMDSFIFKTLKSTSLLTKMAAPAEEIPALTADDVNSMSMDDFAELTNLLSMRVSFDELFGDRKAHTIEKMNLRIKTVRSQGKSEAVDEIILRTRANRKLQSPKPTYAVPNPEDIDDIPAVTHINTPVVIPHTFESLSALSILELDSILQECSPNNPLLNHKTIEKKELVLAILSNQHPISVEVLTEHIKSGVDLSMISLIDLNGLLKYYTEIKPFIYDRNNVETAVKALFKADNDPTVNENYKGLVKKSLRKVCQPKELSIGAEPKWTTRNIKLYQHDYLTDEELFTLYSRYIPNDKKLTRKELLLKIPFSNNPGLTVPEIREAIASKHGRIQIPPDSIAYLLRVTPGSLIKIATAANIPDPKSKTRWELITLLRGLKIEMAETIKEKYTKVQEHMRKVFEMSRGEWLMYRDIYHSNKITRYEACVKIEDAEIPPRQIRYEREAFIFEHHSIENLCNWGDRDLLCIATKRGVYFKGRGRIDVENDDDIVKRRWNYSNSDKFIDEISELQDSPVELIDAILKQQSEWHKYEELKSRREKVFTNEVSYEHLIVLTHDQLKAKYGASFPSIKDPVEIIDELLRQWDTISIHREDLAVNYYRFQNTVEYPQLLKKNSDELFKIATLYDIKDAIDMSDATLVHEILIRRGKNPDNVNVISESRVRCRKRVFFSKQSLKEIAEHVFTSKDPLLISSPAKVIFSINMRYEEIFDVVMTAYMEGDNILEDIDTKVQYSLADIILVFPPEMGERLVDTCLKEKGFDVIKGTFEERLQVLLWSTNSLNAFPHPLTETICATSTETLRSLAPFYLADRRKESTPFTVTRRIMLVWILATGTFPTNPFIQSPNIEKKVEQFLSLSNREICLLYHKNVKNKDPSITPQWQVVEFFNGNTSKFADNDTKYLLETCKASHITDSIVYPIQVSSEIAKQMYWVDNCYHYLQLSTLFHKEPRVPIDVDLFISGKVPGVFLTDRELLDTIGAAPNTFFWKNRQHLVSAVQGYIAMHKESHWVLLDKKERSTNPDTNMITLEKRVWDDPENPILSFGSYKTYRSYQVSELIDSITDDVEGSLFNNPSFDNVHDNLQSFPLGSINELIRVLETRKHYLKSGNTLIDILIAKLREALRSSSVAFKYEKEIHKAMESWSPVQKELLTSIAKHLFVSGMIARFWKGKSHPIPYTWIEKGGLNPKGVNLTTPDERNANFTIQGCLIREMMEKLHPDVTELLWQIKIVRYEFQSHNCYLTNKVFMELFDHASQPDAEGFCLADYSNRAIETWYHFMTRILNIVNADIDVLLGSKFNPDLMGIANHVDPDFGREIEISPN